MSTIYLIRHGQASFGTDDYDRLSDLGRLQATRTGEYLREAGIEVDAAYCGSLRRQRDTGELVLAAQLQTVGITADERFNEINNDEQLETLGPHLAKGDPRLTELLERSRVESKAYQKVLHAVFDYWVTNDCAGFGIQSWVEYRSRVVAAFEELMAREGGGRTVAVFTSGGTIATLVAHVLGLEGCATYRFYEPLFNCSVTQLFYSSSRVSLSYFNDRSFLQLLGAERGENLLSYR